jgi:hypothetical protein
MKEREKKTLGAKICYITRKCGGVSLLDKEKAAHVDYKLVEVLPEPDPQDPLGGERRVRRQGCEGLQQALLVSFLLQIRTLLFLGLPDPDPLVRSTDKATAPDPDPSIIEQKY